MLHANLVTTVSLLLGPGLVFARKRVGIIRSRSCRVSCYPPGLSLGHESRVGEAQVAEYAPFFHRTLPSGFSLGHKSRVGEARLRQIGLFAIGLQPQS